MADLDQNWLSKKSNTTMENKKSIGEKKKNSLDVILKCTLGFPQTWQKHDSWLTTAELFWLFDHKELEWERTRKKTSSSPWTYSIVVEGV